ncbi:MAG: PilZ domain-containing protein [Gammaproteobacteria bacterium]|nr:MAG: PilZ domain-containing protein [Gammaproteobacteria bacterium]
MGEIVIKHFKRSSAGSDDKELVIEIVAESSDTGRFLKRMEESRLTRPCFQTIDMRGRVAGECRHYAFNDRVHYLDDISFQMFEQGLRDNNGVYTVGTFEAIVGGAHTLQAKETARVEAEQRRDEIEQRRLERARAAALERAGDGQREDISERDLPGALVDNPDVLQLGYFRKRTHPRLKYACAVVLERGNIKSSATTRDISVCGVQVLVKGLTTLQPDQDVMVSWPGLEDEAGKVRVTRIPYQVVRSEERGTETVVCLRRLDLEKPDGFTGLLEALIERYQNRYKLDVDDEYQSILSWYYERCYAQSATQIPFFVEQGKDGLCTQAVAMSEGNSHLARFFCTDADNYNFTPLCLPQRLQRLEQSQSFVMAMFRRRGEQDQCMRIHSAADFEQASPAAFQEILRYTLEQSEHCIVKVHVSSVPAAAVSDRKVDEASQRLQYKSEAQMGELRERLKKLHYVGYVVDVTQDFQALKVDSGVQGSGLAAWVGTECRSLEDGKVKEKVSLSDQQLRPELIRFGYVERRREDRYLAETKIDVRIGNSAFEGMSKDISTRGMRIQLQKHVDIKKGATVKIGLVSLQQKKSATNLMDIPYRVVHTLGGDEGTVLMLERVLGGKREGLKEFFVELITKNQHKLGVDIGDIWGATASRIYEALLAANTPTIPFFLARNSEGGAHLQFVGVPETGSPLASYFAGAGGVDFRCLNESRVVSALYDAVQILLRQSRNTGDNPTPFELEMYLYKELDELTGETFIHAATELDFATDARREAFLMKLTEYTDWRCIKIVSTFTRPLDEKALDKMIDSVRSQSKHRAIKLSDLAHSLVGYGEMIDVTDEWVSLRTAARSD